jgi:hypothetical protein
MRVWVLAIVLAGFAITGCKTRKVVAVKPSGLSDLTLEEVIRRADMVQVSFPEVAIKAKVSFKVDKREDSFKMNIRLKRDSIIWMSATYYNMEVARFILTPDTLKMVDRHNRQFYLGDYRFLLEKYETPFNFKALQSILLGNSFDLSNCEKTRIHSSRGKYILSGLSTTPRATEFGDLMQVFASWIDGETYKVSRLRIYEYKGKRSFSADFEDFREVSGLSIPHRIVYDIAGDNKIELVSEYLRIDTVEGQTYPFSIDPKYEPIRLP